MKSTSNEARLQGDVGLKFASFFYPGYYQCSLRNLAAGTSIDEWALLQKRVRSVFIETPEIVPSLGYTDCSDPKILATEASLAHDHGVDAFIFNYYFDGIVAELERPLQVFAQLDTNLEFGLNVCCHMPKRKLPFGVGEDQLAPNAYWSEDQFKSLAEYLCRSYIGNGNYLRCNGTAIITFYHVRAFWYLYGPEGLARRLAILRAVCLRVGIKLHIVGLFSVIGGWNQLPVDSWNLPFDSFSCYVVLPDFQGSEAVQSFPKLAEKWQTLLSDQALIPPNRSFVSCIGSGWNATARGKAGYNPTIHGLRFPYFPVVVDDDPREFEKYLNATVDRTIADDRYLSSLMFLGPWNEWSEGCYLLPDERFGMGKLQAVKRVKERVLKSDDTSF